MPAKLFRSVSALVFTASLFATIQVVSAATPAELQKLRHDHYKELGDAFKSVRDASKAAEPDFAALEKAAEIVNKASVDQATKFANAAFVGLEHFNFKTANRQQLADFRNFT